MKGLDGNMWIVREDKNARKYWARLKASKKKKTTKKKSTSASTKKKKTTKKKKSTKKKKTTTKKSQEERRKQGKKRLKVLHLLRELYGAQEHLLKYHDFKTKDEREAMIKIHTPEYVVDKIQQFHLK